MKTNKATKLAMIYGLTSLMSGEDDIFSSHKEFTEDGRMKPVNHPVKKIIPKGLKQFFYGENEIFAISKKVADKKAKKKGYL